MLEPVLIIPILGFGVLVGAILAALVSRGRDGLDWGMSCLGGVVGAFLGGTLGNTLFGYGYGMEIPGIIGCVVGALVSAGMWVTYQRSAYDI